MTDERKDSFLLHVNNVYKQYGEKVVLDNVDLSVSAGAKEVIPMPNDVIPSQLPVFVPRASRGTPSPQGFRRWRLSPAHTPFTPRCDALPILQGHLRPDTGLNDMILATGCPLDAHRRVPAEEGRSRVPPTCCPCGPRPWPHAWWRPFSSARNGHSVDHSAR